MTVYVETNFVLEHAIQQEEYDACAEIISLASKGQITLAVPAFSLAEPHVAIAGKKKARSRLGHELRAQLLELGRSKPYHGIPQMFEALAAVLIARAEFEREGLRGTITKLLSTATVISLDSTTLQSATGMQAELDLSDQDAIVLASVLIHLDLHKPAHSCFLNRNSKDFENPSVEGKLTGRGCKLFGNFAAGLRYIISQTPPLE